MRIFPPIIIPSNLLLERYPGVFSKGIGVATLYDYTIGSDVKARNRTPLDANTAGP